MKRVEATRRTCKVAVEMLAQRLRILGRATFELGQFASAPALVHELTDFLRHVCFELDKYLLMLDIQLA